MLNAPDAVRRTSALLRRKHVDLHARWQGAAYPNRFTRDVVPDVAANLSQLRSGNICQRRDAVLHSPCVGFLTLRVLAFDYDLAGARPRTIRRAIVMSGIIWIIIVGFVAGMIARWLSPGPNTPTGFILTTVLGIAGAFLATFIGQSIGWYRADQGAGFIAATVGAVAVLFIWNRLVARGVISDPGNRV
jgi:uncharacterized membrane protein YeaQ/YmgE (transglycosylase-associated protein family)